MEKVKVESITLKDGQVIHVDGKKVYLVTRKWVEGSPAKLTRSYLEHEIHWTEDLDLEKENRLYKEKLNESL